jgi:hypothetical protein
MQERRNPVRDLTKSMLSLSWAMSLFGLKQMASLFNPQSNATSSFEAVTRSAEDQLGPVTRSTFRTGDNLQRGLVDLMFSFFTLGLWPGGNRGGGRGGGAGRSGWGSGGWSCCGDTSSNDWGRGDAGQQSGWAAGGMGQQGGWAPGDTETGQQGNWTASGAGQQGGWTVGGMGQQAGWSPESGGGWQVGGGGGMGSGGGGGWSTSGGAGVASAGAEAFRSGSDLAAQTMGWGIDMMQQSANAVSQTMEGASAQQAPAQDGGGWTSGGGSGPR